MHDEGVVTVHRSDVEVLNFGVPGYGLDQAYLRYRQDGRQFHPHIVLIGFMSENIRRAVSVYRPFYQPESHAPLAKPRFRVEHDTLILIPNPMASAAGYRELLASPESVLPRLGANDYFYQTGEHAGPWDGVALVRLVKLGSRVLRRVNGPTRGGVFNPGSEAFRVTIATMTRFVRDVRADGAVPLILLFPPQEDVRRYVDHRTLTYAPLREALNSSHLPYLEVTEAFAGTQAQEVSGLVPGHYSAGANLKIAAFLARQIPQLRPGRQTMSP